MISSASFCRSIAPFASLLLVVGLMFSACATKNVRKLEKGGLTLMYKPQLEAGSEVAELKLVHPFNISEEEVRKHLYALHYQELSLLGKEKSVFTLKEIDEVSEIFAKALRHARPGRVIAFKYETPGGSTSGNIFVTPNTIHWKLDSIRGQNYSSGILPEWGGSTWRLTLKKGQKYHVTKKLLVDRTDENWIMAEAQLPDPVEGKVPRKMRAAPTSSRAPASQSPAGKQTPAADPELEKKLEFLKNLREKNLIDEEEYKRKRKELLDTLL
ncbi:MAG: hypothetical protein COV67_00030 [Nitrospinae bacterium CG11_big_fil_rev_8_21_14_0_20_56_8]|nr:MAG: hypothetical protein COV67_00030 [Nitrospinae bacterium CG11_big_fil_rev_8_21_14_0_20_56_8]